MKDQIKEQLELLMYQYAYSAYSDQYSSSSYSEYKRNYKCMIAPLITLAKLNGLVLEDIKASYCGCEYNATEFSDIEELTEYW